LLFHFSENSNIAQFIPRPSKKVWGGRPYVWAVHASTSANYLFPRNCPRISIAASKKLPIQAYIPPSTLNSPTHIIFIEESWLPLVQTCTLYRYQFSPHNFSLIDANAGYYVSKQPVIPIKQTKISNCIHALAAHKVQLVVCNLTTLKNIRHIVIQKMRHFSIIKWSNIA